METIFILFMPVNVRLVITGKGLGGMNRATTRHNATYITLIQVCFTETPIFEVEKRVVTVIEGAFLTGKVRLINLLAIFWQTNLMF